MFKETHILYIHEYSLLAITGEFSGGGLVVSVLLSNFVLSLPLFMVLICLALRGIALRLLLVLLG